jgi:hypothetical protein
LTKIIQNDTLLCSCGLISLLTCPNEQQPITSCKGRVKKMLWNKFVCTLLAENLRSGFLANNAQQVQLAITASIRGKKDPRGDLVYTRPEMLRIQILEIRQASHEQITVFCTLNEPLPLGFRPGNYTLRFAVMGNTYICGDIRQDIDQMLEDGHIPAATWKKLRQEAARQ